MASKNDQKCVVKNTSLQGWSKLTEEYFGKKLRVEDRKDREAIYTLLEKYGAPHERFHSFESGDKLTQKQLDEAVKNLGFPYWISASPKLGITDINRTAKLRLESVKDGWEFLQDLARLEDYKILVMQYADNPTYKGSVLVSQGKNGIADFVKGDKHPQLIAGLTISDPLLFDKNGIVHYSTTAPKDLQEEIYKSTIEHQGHYEFQFGELDGKVGLSFFDYNDELAYEDIDSLFRDLVAYYDKENGGDYLVKGLPASLGKVTGVCRVILSTDPKSYSSIQEGEILVSDSTNPEMTLVMKKAVAIVTDLGGVTSHAAIVTRELEIPCIVGAKNATEVLKNGMKVEVNASEGIVKNLD